MWAYLLVYPAKNPKIADEDRGFPVLYSPLIRIGRDQHFSAGGRVFLGAFGNFFPGKFCFSCGYFPIDDESVYANSKVFSAGGKTEAVCPAVCN